MTIPRWVRSIAWLAAAIAFAVVGALLLRKQPGLLDDVEWHWLAAVVALVPVMVWLNVAEYRISARYLDITMGWTSALRITVMGSAANMLPLPGALVVRTAGLATRGASTASSAAITVVFATSWIATSCSLSGGALIALELETYGAVLIAVGGVALIVFLVLSMWRYRQPGSLATASIALKLGVVVIEAIQLYLCFRALNVSVSPLVAAAIQVSAVMGSAFALVPAGLGVREGAGALLGELVGLGHARGFVAVALNRVASMIVLIPLSVIFSLRADPPAR